MTKDQAGELLLLVNREIRRIEHEMEKYERCQDHPEIDKQMRLIEVHPELQRIHRGQRS